MPADVILEMRVKWGRNGIGERRIKSPTVAKFRQKSAGLESIAFYHYSLRGGPPNPICGYGNLAEKEPYRHVGLAPPSVGTAIGGYYVCRQMRPRFLSLFRPDRWFCIVIISGKCRKCDPQDVPNLPDTPGPAWRSKSILFQRISNKNDTFSVPATPGHLR